MPPKLRRMTATRPPLDEDLRDAYLRRLGLSLPLAPSVETLFAVHRAQVERIPYESVWVWLGERRTIEPLDSVRYVTGPGGRGGYCYHQNGSLATLLGWLGFTVRWHVGGVQGHRNARAGATGDHLALTVTDLPTTANPGGTWFADAGLGDGLHQPMPLLTGEYHQGPHHYVLLPSTAAPGGWRFEADEKMSLVGMDFLPDDANVAVLEAKHETLQSSPSSSFVRVLVACRRDAHGVDLLRGKTLKRTDKQGESTTELSTRTDWYAALADTFGMTLSDVDDEQKTALWQKATKAHEIWLATTPT